MRNYFYIKNTVSHHKKKTNTKLKKYICIIKNRIIRYIFIKKMIFLENNNNKSMINFKS